MHKKGKKTESCWITWYESATLLTAAKLHQNLERNSITDSKQSNNCSTRIWVIRIKKSLTNAEYSPKSIRLAQSLGIFFKLYYAWTADWHLTCKQILCSGFKFSQPIKRLIKLWSFQQQSGSMGSHLLTN